MGAFNNLLGKKFGRLTVVERMPNNKWKQAMWRCVCDCGNEVVVEAHQLRRGHTKSCGCYQREQSAEFHTTHGMRNSPLYRVYSTMKCRCYNPNDQKYYRYGARGIKMCNEWLNNPQSFFGWANTHGYKKGLSIDRIDNDGDYCPENCRWADDITQANNKSNSHYHTYNGETKTIAEWARELGLTYSAVKSRICKGSFDKLYGVENAGRTMVSFHGVTMSISEWALFLGLNYSTVRSRVRKGSFERLFPKDKIVELPS